MASTTKNNPRGECGASLTSLFFAAELKAKQHVPELNKHRQTSPRGDMPRSKADDNPYVYDLWPLNRCVFWPHTLEFATQRLAKDFRLKKPREPVVCQAGEQFFQLIKDQQHSSGASVPM